MSDATIAEQYAKTKDANAINIRQEFTKECYDCDRIGYLLTYQTPGQARRKNTGQGREHCTLYCIKCGATHRVTRSSFR